MWWLTIPAAFVGGAFLWSFTEYAMHNWRGHKGKGKNPFSREHLAHHADSDYFTPTYKKVRTASVVTLLVLPPLAWAGGLPFGVALVAGFLASYIGYEVLHRRIHTHPPTGPYGRWARKHHFYHHFSRPNLNHGVTSPIWDVVFGTLERPEVVRVPAKKAMSWLLDPETGDVAAPYAADYVVVRRGDKRRSREARKARKVAQEVSASV